MNRQPSNPLNEIRWEDFGRRLTKWGQGKMLTLLAILIGVVVVIWLATGIYSVGPGEVGVVRQFGKEVGQTSPGLHWRWPAPIQRVDKVNMSEVRRSMVGFREVSPEQFQVVTDESLMLTGDENIVDIRVFVYYRVKDASQFLFKVEDVEQMLKTSTEVALRGTVGKNTIDFVMLEGRPAVQNETMVMLQWLMDTYEAGVVITEVKLQEVDAPTQVRDAFNDVVKAREDKNTLIRQAEGYAADIVPKARGEKEKAILEAEAYKQQRILRAEGDAAKFLAVLEEYLKAPMVTRQRLYLEAIERILPNLEKIIIDPESSGNLLQFLPLREITGPGEPQVEPQEEGAE